MKVGAWRGEIPIPADWGAVVVKDKDLEDVKYVVEEALNEVALYSVAESGSRFFEAVPFYLKYSGEVTEVSVDNLASATANFFSKWEELCLELDASGWPSRSLLSEINVRAEELSVSIPEVAQIGELASLYLETVYGLFFSSGFSSDALKNCGAASVRDREIEERIRAGVSCAESEEVRYILKDWLSRIERFSGTAHGWKALTAMSAYLLSYAKVLGKQGDAVPTLIALHRACELFFSMILIREGAAWLSTNGNVEIAGLSGGGGVGFWKTWQAVVNAGLNPSMRSKEFVGWINRARNSAFMIHGAFGMSLEETERSLKSVEVFMETVEPEVWRAVRAKEKAIRLFPQGLERSVIFDWITDFDVFVTRVGC